MPEKLIDEAFNKMMWRFNSIEPVNGELETRLRIAFNEGIITGQSYFVEKLKPHMASLKGILPFLP